MSYNARYHDCMLRAGRLEESGVERDIKSLITATGGVLRTLAGPPHAYSAAAGQVPDGLGGVQVNTIPPVHSAGYYGGPAYTNLAGSVAITGAGTVANSIADPYGDTSVAYTDGSVMAQQGVKFGQVSFVSGTTYTFRCIVKPGATTRYVQISAPNAVFTSIYANFDLAGDGALGTVNGGTHYITKLTDGWFEISFVAIASGSVYSDAGWLFYVTSASAPRFPVYQGTTSLMFYVSRTFAAAIGYAVPYIPAGQSVVSTVGTTTGNGIQVPLTGSDAADALSACFSGGVGTVGVLMKMGAGSAEIPNSTVFNLLSVKGASSELLFSSIGASSEDNIALSNDGATSAAVAATTWSRNEYHMKFVEFNGTKFRVGNKRYTEAGVAIDADIVWSSATLAGGTAFDGSWNPTTFLRWFLNSTVPNWMRVMMVSNLAGLGDTELLRRITKYGKF